MPNDWTPIQPYSVDPSAPTPTPGPWQQYAINKQGGMTDYGLWMMKQGYGQNHPIWNDPEFHAGHYSKFLFTNPMGGGAPTYASPGASSPMSSLSDLYSQPQQPTSGMASSYLNSNYRNR